MIHSDYAGGTGPKKKAPSVTGGACLVCFGLISAKQPRTSPTGGGLGRRRFFHGETEHAAPPNGQDGNCKAGQLHGSSNLDFRATGHPPYEVGPPE
jgi:hypothetical protein